MKCTNCDREYEEWRAECPYCKGKNMKDGERSNADCLNIIANINITLFIIASLYYFYNAFILLIDGYIEVMVIGINLVYGVSLLLVGFTIFFLLKTIVDIYYKTNKKLNT